MESVKANGHSLRFVIQDKFSYYQMELLLEEAINTCPYAMAYYTPRDTSYFNSLIKNNKK
jgi:hypothetical protein